MKCRKIQNNLSAFRDKELDPAVSRKIEKHLLTCVNCRVVFDRLNEVEYFLNTKTKVLTSPYFLTRVRAKIRQTNPVSTGFSERLLFPAYIIAGLAIGAFLGISAGRAVMSPTTSISGADLGSYYANADVFNTLPDNSLASRYVNFTQTAANSGREVK